MTAIFRRIAVLVPVLVCSLAFHMSAVLAQTKQPDEGFVSLDKLPPTEQFPAARLLIAAYVVVVVVLFLYLLSVARRLNTVQREVDRLEADVKRTGRA